MRTLSIEEMNSVGGGMRLDQAHGIWVQDQTLAGYQREYGSFLGTIEYGVDQTRLAAGYDAVYTPPAHYVE